MYPPVVTFWGTYRLIATAHGTTLFCPVCGWVGVFLPGEFTTITFPS